MNAEGNVEIPRMRHEGVRLQFKVDEERDAVSIGIWRVPLVSSRQCLCCCETSG